MGGFVCWQRWDGKIPQRKDPQLRSWKKKNSGTTVVFTTVMEANKSLKQKKIVHFIAAET